MTEITLRLSDEQARLLAEEAERLNTSIEDAVLRRLFQAGEQRQQGNIRDEEFERALDYVTEKNAELMRRLA